MSGRLQLIEQKLKAIDPAAFQNLCDIYLASRENKFTSFNRTGSQFGKRKTVKGTPDTFFRLSDGSLRYIEFTTTDVGLVEKIMGDIDKCLDSEKTGVAINEIHKIIICFNSRIDVDEETDITKYADSKNVQIELIGLDWLALEIYSKHLILAKDILGIPLDTGQLLPLENFIDEYNNRAGKLSTPLDNIFLHRKQELAEIESDLSQNDLLIISGAPGVGKTKIAIESLNIFLVKHSDYSAFVVTKKDQDIFEDLRIHLEQEKNYVLLIDDANRQLVNFKQILGVFKEKRKGNIKLLITVRNYALNDIENECYEYDPKKLVIKKFTDEEITTLINSESFEIRNHKYQKKIVELADGNARLAVMAARLAKQQNEIFLYGDICDLFDAYFQTFIKDFNFFENKTYLKTLGIISFFFTIDRSNKQFIEILLHNFEINYHDFNEAIDELEKRELIEVQFSHARVTEQVMATYFFYKVFIKDELLSFKTLLFNYYFDWKIRFKDTIIPSNNSFGYENMLKKVSNSLDEFLLSVYRDKEKVLEFFSLFWFYKPDETLKYFYEKVKALPEPTNPEYTTHYETNDFVHKTDKTLDFISDFFYHNTDHFIPALELAFEYCRKVPDKLPELVRRIREKLKFCEKDERIGYKRQEMLFDLLIKKIEEKQLHYIEVFFALAKTFLSHHFEVTESRKHSISIYHYSLPINEITKNFRKKLWETLFQNYDNYPDKVFKTIKSFRSEYPGWINELLEFDLSFLLPFIESKLDSKKFLYAHYVNDLILRLNDRKLAYINYDQLKSKFNTTEYEIFSKFDWNRLRGKAEFEFENYHEFQKLKENEIRSFFICDTENEFAPLLKTIENFICLEKENTWGFNESLNIILDENFLKNKEIGFLLLTRILDRDPKILAPLYSPLRLVISESDEWAMRMWEFLKSWKSGNKIIWQLAFFDCLPPQLCNPFICKELLSTINSIEQNIFLMSDDFVKFVSIDKDIIEKILKTIIDKIENLKIKIYLPYNFFEKYSDSVNDFNLLSKAYIQQDKFNDSFDFGRKGFKKLFQLNPGFLIQYIDSLFSIKNILHRRNIHNHLAFVWDFENIDELVEEALNLLIRDSIYFGILEHHSNIFFNKIDESHKLKAIEFIKKYISKYNNDRKKMNTIFDVIRNSLKEFFEEVFLHYLSLNTNLEDFRKISWRGNSGIYSGNVNIGEIKAKDWQKILDIVKKCDYQLNLIPIKAYIKEEIECELRNADWERRRKFVEPDW